MSSIYRKFDTLNSPMGRNSMKEHANGKETIRQLRETHRLLIESCSDFGDVFTKSFAFPYLVVMTNADGHIIYVCGDDRSLHRAANEDILLGGSVSIEDKGINPFSVVMELQRPLYLERRERLIHTIRDWDAFCFPIKGNKKKSEGFIGFLFSDFTPGPGVAPFLQAIVMKMEMQYADKCKQQKTAAASTNNLEDRLFQFELTSRERQVAAFWMLDYDYKQISKVIGISENTVRVLINKINGKLKVNSKASLILRVFDAI